jgi:phosphoglycolate phosphatase
MVRTFRAIPASKLRLIVFDLDGTLIDSGADLFAAVNAMLSNFGRHPLPETVIASYIGDGAPLLVRRALGDPTDQTFFDAALSYFISYYHDHKLDQTKVYPGVFDALEEMRREADIERSMAVLTNKPIRISQAICDALGLTPYFFRIYGGNSFPSKKPDPEGLNALIREAGVRPDETLMIGDSSVDVLTARNADTWSMGCTYGLSPHTLTDADPDCLVDSVAEWPLALNGSGANVAH